MCRYLGLDIDFIKMEIRLPEDKLGKSTISKKELESLGGGGLLAHCMWWMGEGWWLRIDYCDARPFGSAPLKLGYLF